MRRQCQRNLRNAFAVVCKLKWRCVCTVCTQGVPECLKGVRKQLRKGASHIKVCASGGVMSEVDAPEHQQFSDEELRAIVEARAVFEAMPCIITCCCLPF